MIIAGENMNYKIGLIKNQKTGQCKNCHIQNLNANHTSQIIALQNKIVALLSDKDLFHPFFEHEIKHLFTHRENIILGVYTDENELIAFRAATVTGKEFDEINYFLENKYHCHQKLLLNGAFVDEDYRGNRLQVKMSEYTINLAKERNVELLFTVIHPDNVASIKSIASLGFDEIKEINVYIHQHRRLLFVKELN